MGLHSWAQAAYTHLLFLDKVRDLDQGRGQEMELELLPLFLADSDEVIDAGANYCSYTHRLAQICRSGVVYAFEPIPFTYDICSRIVRHYQFQNVRLYPNALGERAERPPGSRTARPYCRKAVGAAQQGKPTLPRDLPPGSRPPRPRAGRLRAPPV
ncbi:MAG: FkbM family methyltransferase [Armatimonadetes bacterium]|nr:FkbM family methyltransferase [Armatimonadota bacterium]